MKFIESEVKKILVVSLSNIGDVILTFPVIDILKENFSEAEIVVVVGPKAASLLEGNRHLSRTVIFDKHQSLMDMARWAFERRKEKYDLVVDLRNTAIPILIGSKFRTSLWNKQKKDQHMRHKHLDRLRDVYPFRAEAKEKYALFLNKKDQLWACEIIEKFSLNNPFIIVGPGAADHSKRWFSSGFAKVCDEIKKCHGMNIIFVGNKEDVDIIADVKTKMSEEVIDLSGKTTLTRLACLLIKSSFALVNDSAIMHMASYLDIPVAAIFGPTDPKKYGPWSPQCCVIKKDGSHQDHANGIDYISPDKVLESLKINFSYLFEQSGNFPKPSS